MKMTENLRTSTFILRVMMAFVLLSHGVPGMLDGGVNAFGDLFLNKIGFSPVGIPLAWAIKVLHVVCAVLLLLNKYIRLASLITIFILLMGIILVHWNDGWFVVGGGRNGIEYNVVLICVLLSFMFPNGLQKQLSSAR